MPEVKEVDGVEVTISDDDKSLVDPGQKEGHKKDPRVAQDDIKPDSPRYKEIYGKWKDTERRLEKLEKEGKGNGNAELIEEMRRHNASLEETIKQMGTNKSVSDDNESLTELNIKLEDLKGLKKKAREAADFDTETRIDDNILDLKVDIRDLKKSIEEKKNIKPVVDKVKTPELSEEDQAEYKDWIDENEWFTKDTKRRTAAIGFEKKVLREDEFKDASITEVLEEVSKRVEEKFKPVQGTNHVEGGGRLSSTQTPGTVKLSKTEVDIANGLGLPLEKYAKQKAMINGRKK